MDKPHKKAFDHCLHCPHFSDLIDNADISLSDPPDKILEQGNNEFPVKKIPGEQYNLATDVVTKDFEVANKLTQPTGDLPRDDELLKEILGDDYATQSLSRNKLYEQENFTGINSGKLSNTEGDKAEIDKIIEEILGENNQDISLDDELDIRPVNTECSDIDAFLQKYLTDDDSPEIAQNEPSEIIDDSSSEITDDLAEILDDASSKIMDEESAETLDDLSELMGGESSEIIGESSGIMFDESPEIIADPSEIISDVSSEVLHVGEESNIDELIERILNDDIGSENLFEENSLAGVDRTNADISMQRAGPETKPRAQAEHSAQSTVTQRVTNLPRRTP
ncbi:MAG: hypothetical protein KAU21_08355, partial [Gammaproteobacteria bacterium]|nr:hypothetical protein [Gammaproteobacteria bacterium]